MKKALIKTFGSFLTAAMVVTTTSAPVFAEGEDVLDENPQDQSVQIETAQEEAQSPVNADIEEDNLQTMQSEQLEEEAQTDEEKQSKEQIKETAEENANTYGIMLLDAGDEETTYTVYVTFYEDFTDATVTLVGPQSYSFSGDIAAYDAVMFTNVVPGDYVVNATAKNAAGENVKGRVSISSVEFQWADGNVLDTEISNMISEVNNEITAKFSFNNPFPAQNGECYSFDNDKVEAYIQAADGKKYPLKTGNDGYLFANVPANQPYTLVASGWSYGRVDGVNEDESVKYSFGPLKWPLSADKMTQNKTFSVNIPMDGIKVENSQTKSYPVTFTVKDKDTNDIVPNTTITVVDPDGKEYTAKTDENGQAKVVLPTPNEKYYDYTVKALAKDGRKVSSSFTYENLKNGMTTLELMLPEADSFYANVNVIMDDDILSTEEYGPFSKKKYIPTQISALKVPLEGVAKCTKVEAFREDGSSVPIELSTSSTYASAYVDNDYKQGIDNNEIITVNFYIEYIDQDVNYDISVSHVFINDKGEEVYREASNITAKGGEPVSIDQLRTNGNDWVQIDVPGYDIGAWFVSGDSIEGGNDNPIIGSPDQRVYRATNNATVTFYMPHDKNGVDVEIYYTYKEQFVEYLANNPKATGTMATDWAKISDKKTIATNSYQLTHYNFVGWNTSADGKGKSYKPGDSVIIEDSNITLYAQWEIEKFTVTWVNDDGTKLEVDAKVPYGDMPSYDGKTPEKKADAKYTYKFIGWTPTISEVTEDITYTAVYEKVAIPEKPAETKKPTKANSIGTAVSNELGLWTTLLTASVSGYIIATNKKRKNKK